MHKSYRQKTITFMHDSNWGEWISQKIWIQEDLYPRTDRIPRRSESKYISIQELIGFLEDLNPSRSQSKNWSYSKKISIQDLNPRADPTQEDLNQGRNESKNIWNEKDQNQGISGIQKDLTAERAA